MARRAAKRDENERGIITALTLNNQAVAIQEQNIDLYVIATNVNLVVPEFLVVPMEVKMPKGKLNERQKEFHKQVLESIGYRIPIVRNEDEALKLVGR